MTLRRSAGEPQALMTRFEKYQALENAAKRRRDIPAANRYFDKVSEALDALVDAGEAGRNKLEQLMQDSNPSTRGRAARRVLEWDPDRAIPVLARLLYEKFGSEIIPFHAVTIEIEAQSALTDYFGLDMFDPVELPGRLSALGIELPKDLARRLRRED